jgi:hypothetical protein
MSLYMNASAEMLAPRREPRVPVGDPQRPPLSLAKAQHYACKIAEWIAPRCQKVEPVGEIRRRCQTVTTIELLAMPRYEANANTLFDFLNDYVGNQATGAPRWLHSTGNVELQGLRPGHYDDSATLLLPHCKLVLHTANARELVSASLRKHRLACPRRHAHGARTVAARHVGAGRADSRAQQDDQAALRGAHL